MQYRTHQSSCNYDYFQEKELTIDKNFQLRLEKQNLWSNREKSMHRVLSKRTINVWMDLNLGESAVGNR
jgi:hypothetical protein